MAFYNFIRYVIFTNFVVFKMYANSLNDLPVELHQYILSYSTVKEIINIRQVSSYYRRISDNIENKELIKNRLKNRFLNKFQNSEKLKNHFLNELNKIEIIDKYFFQKLDSFYEVYSELECLFEHKKNYGYQPQQPLSYSIYDIIFDHPSLKFNHITPLLIYSNKYNNIIKEIIYNIIDSLKISDEEKKEYIHKLNEKNHIHNVFKAIKLYKEYINSKIFESFYGINSLIFIGLQAQNIEIKNLDHIKYIGFEQCVIGNLNIQNLKNLIYLYIKNNNIKKLFIQNNILIKDIDYNKNISNFISIKECPSLIKADLRNNGLSHIKHDNSSNAHILLKGNKSFRLLFHSIGRNKKLCGYALERIFINFYKELKESLYNWVDTE